MANKCKDCGCTCKRCITSDHDVQLHVEIENLKQRLLEKESHIVQMETNFLNETNKFPGGELVAIREELLTWQDKYKRLYEAHRRVQRVNQGLEDKLLKLVDACETDKSTLTKDIATLSHKLAEANYTIKKLTEDNERYKNDVSLAIQFLQCKQSNFVAHRFDSLPPEVQSQVSNHMTTRKKIEEKKITPDVKNIKVPIPTFPPTAMVYSIPKTANSDNKKSDIDVEAPPPVDVVSAAIMAKVLEERQKERSMVKHCDTCTCSKNLKIVYDSSHHSIGTQTGEYKEMLCLRCNDSIKAISDSNMKVIRTPDTKPQKIISVYPLETIDASVSMQTNNIVKVQPNNFLLDNKIKTVLNSNSSSLLELNKPNISPKNNIINPNNHVIHNEINTFQEKSLVRRSESLKNDVVAVNISYSDPEKADSETNIDLTSTKIIAIDKLRASRHHNVSTMPSRSGARNILLDNAQTIAPLLLTKTTKVKENIIQTQGGNTDTSSENMLRLSSMASETTAQNQQRVAEWIRSNLEEDISSSENSRSDPVRSNYDALLDKAKYAEMEENVKRFLFGESEFMKTVELGKRKYQTMRDGDGSQKTDSPETEIV